MMSPFSALSIAFWISSKSEDRRSIFEEASGIVKYRTRKEESEKKLEQTKLNLLRINDIISEIESNIEPLKLQSEKAKKFLSLRDELKSIEIGLFLYNIEDFKKKVKVGTGYEVEIDSKTVEGKQVLYTGGKTKIYRDSELVVEYTNVVLGDVNGDAEINSGDLFRIRQHLLSLVTLKDEFSKAADVNKDSKLSASDILNIQKHINNAQKAVSLIQELTNKSTTNIVP